MRLQLKSLQLHLHQLLFIDNEFKNNASPEPKCAFKDHDLKEIRKNNEIRDTC